MIRERKQNVPSMIVDLRYDNFQKKRQTKRQLVIDVSFQKPFLFKLLLYSRNGND